MTQEGGYVPCQAGAQKWVGMVCPVRPGRGGGIVPYALSGAQRWDGMVWLGEGATGLPKV